MSSLFPKGDPAAYTWTFFRAGGVDQVDIAKASDIENLAALDPKLWLALACPTKGLELDKRTLEMIDTDHDERIRPEELLGAIQFCKEAFRTLDLLLEPGETVPLSAIHPDTPLGRDLTAGAKRILSNLGKPEATEISLANVSDTEAIFAGTRLNGDGVVPPSSAETDELRQVILDVITTCGGVKDRGGEEGADKEHVERFFDEVARLHAWVELGEREGVMTLGEATPSAFLAYTNVRAKLNDFFTRCHLLAYDERLISSVQPSDLQIAGARARDISATDAEVILLPLAQPNREGELHLGATLNPAWRAAIREFRTRVLLPMVGELTSVTLAEWNRIVGRFDEFEAWQNAKPATVVEALGLDRIRALARGGAKEQALALVAEDAALANESSQIENIEKMIRFRSNLVRLLRNFVSFGEFYKTRKAIFQTGRLYVDGRACDLCLPVEDVAKHAALAGLAHSYLVYAECKRRKDKTGASPEVEKQTIVAIVTAGGVDNLMVGRNGLFYDRQGEHWDATVTKVIENPIDIRQAFFAPYKKFIRLVQEQVTKRAAAAADDNQKAMEVHAAEVATADKSPTHSAPAPPPAAPAPTKKIDVGTVAALGVAVAGVGTLFSSILGFFGGLGVYMPLGVLGIILAISGPNMLITWLKLRQRNIGPILDASGWAVNAFARINVSFGNALTSVAVLPPGSIRRLHDPFADKRRPWKLYVTLATLTFIAGLWFVGKLDGYLPDAAKAARVLHRTPATMPATAPPAAAPAPVPH